MKVEKNGFEDKTFLHQTLISDSFKTGKKARKKVDRFNGKSEEEIMKLGLPEYWKPGLDIMFIGVNPGLFSAFKGHYYASPANHFWKAMYLSKLIPEPFSYTDDHKCLDLGMGFTDIVSRPTRKMADLSKAEIAEGAKVLQEKLKQYKPKIAVFNGKGIYEIYSGQKKFMFGKQPEPINDGSTWIWVMPSSSSRCAQLPRAVDKVPFFEALRKFKEYLNGQRSDIAEEEIVFASVVLTNRISKTKSEDLVKTESEPKYNAIELSNMLQIKPEKT